MAQQPIEQPVWGPRLWRTATRFAGVFLALGGADALIQYGNGTYDVRHLEGALLAAVVLAAQKLLDESNAVTASPSMKHMRALLKR